MNNLATNFYVVGCNSNNMHHIFINKIITQTPIMIYIRFICFSLLFLDPNLSIPPYLYSFSHLNCLILIGIIRIVKFPYPFCPIQFLKLSCIWFHYLCLVNPIPLDFSIKCLPWPLHHISFLYTSTSFYYESTFHLANFTSCTYHK